MVSDEEMEWFIAVCENCTPRLPQPFRDRGERDEWAGKHSEATGHNVTVYATLRKP